MFAQVYSGGIQAVDGYIVSVEADVSDGLPFFNISDQYKLMSPDIAPVRKLPTIAPIYSGKVKLQ